MNKPECPFQVGVAVSTETGHRMTRHTITALCIVGQNTLLRVDPSVPGTGGLNAWLDARRFEVVRAEALR
jgi:hypothetical protein